MSADRLECPECFPAPSRRPDVLFLVGEHSADQQAARMVRDWKKKRPETLVCAWGGPALAKEGAELIYDFTQASVVGLVEVLRNAAYFRTMMSKVVAWIEEHQPRVVCLVDYPGFNLRLADQLKKRKLSRQGGGEIRLVYYIAPQVWAWKKKRRFSMARLLDALAVIFPFETEVFADTELKAEFVGHPFLGEPEENTPTYDAEGPVLLLPGSRRQAVRRILPLLLRGYAHLLKTGTSRKGVIIYPDEEVRTEGENLLAAKEFESLRHHLLWQSKQDPIRGAAVLTSSGTMSLHCALAGIPGAIVYRAHPITYWIGRMVISIPYLGINNLLLKEPMYPEFIQGAAHPAKLGKRLEQCLSDEETIEQTRQHRERLIELLQADAQADAASWLDTQWQLGKS
ncbi:MAG: lipid-A-disaccharide synthase [Opitutales bacterium]|nr:lipid-A-disaccharide synthase [Opitutales bacterium]